MERTDLVAGVTVKRRDGSNLYDVVERQDRFLHLKCVYFGGKEDLGDQIFCTYEGELIWIAMWHGGRMECLGPTVAA